MEGNQLEAPEPIRGGSESTARAPPHSPPSVPVGNAMFRILCSMSRLGSVIGKRGEVIKQLKESTQSSILVEKAPSDPTYCYIRIVGDVGSSAWVKLGEQEEEVTEVTRAQYALIRVFEAAYGYHGTVSCRLLMEGRYVGDVIGEGGILIDNIRKETGSSVDIIQDDLPRFADPDDVIVKMEGDVMAVKKALVSISSCLQACQVPLKTTQETFSQPRIDSLSQGHSALEYHPVTTIKQLPLRVVLNILCSNERASCVIGKEYHNMSATKSEKGVSISVGDTIADCDERIITLLETLKDRRNSQAQRAIVLVFSKLYETATENDNVLARLVVPSNQIEGLVGKSSHRIFEMQQLSGALIQVLDVKQNPKCVAGNNQVVQISGNFPNVKEAINYVTTKLIKNLIKHSFHFTSRPVDAYPCIRPQSPFPNMFIPTAAYAQNFGQYPFMNMFTPTSGYAPNFGRPPTMGHSSQTPFWSQIPAAPRGVHDGNGGLPSTMANLRLDSRLISSNDSNTTMEFTVPDNAVDFVFGHNFIENLRKVSGARIIVPEPYGGPSNRIIVISGTPHQIQSVRNVLQILTLA